jgi:DNA topoisomerase-1
VKAAQWDNKTTRRVVFHEITEPAIQEAFKHPREINMQLVDSQQARRVLDRLVGYQLSPLLWQKISGGRKMGLSAGRVQSVALRLVVDREREVEAFTSTEYWTIEAILQSEREHKTSISTFTAVLQGMKGQRSKLILSSKAASSKITKELKGADFKVTKVTNKEVHSRPAPPFITSTLQQEAWRKLRFSTKRTMSVAQQLYEGIPIASGEAVGLITYMRTDSTQVAPQALHEARQYIKQRYGPTYLPKAPRVYSKKAKGAQEAHEAIRPTSMFRDPDDIKPYLKPEQLRLYDLIWKRMLSSQMTDAESDSTRVDIEASKPTSPTKTYLLKASGSVVKFEGFRVLYSEASDDNSKDQYETPLPNLSAKEKLGCLDVSALQHFTQPPPRYTEAMLVRILEEKGIGRPSTYAPTISVIQDRNYVNKEQGHFKPTHLGTVVSDHLTNHFPGIMDLGFTAQMEESLDQIAEGTKEWVPVLQEFYEPFQKALTIATELMPRVKVEEPSDEICELCGQPMVIKTSRFGRFLACSGFPECRGKKSLMKKTGVSCPGCTTGELVERRGKGRLFYGCTQYPNCKFIITKQPLKEPCPECNSLLLVSKRDTAQCQSCSFQGPIPTREDTELTV